MILNGLGENLRRLYLAPQCFEHKPLEHLLGRTLDLLSEQDVTRLFAGIARKAWEELSISSRLVYGDTASFLVSGSSEGESEVEVAISITSGIHETIALTSSNGCEHW